MKRRPLLLTGVLLTLILLVLSIAPTAAQEVIVLDENRLGEISAVNPSPSYIFSAQAGQQVEIEVLAIGAGLFPQFTVFDQNGALVQAVGNPIQATSIKGTVTFPLAGNYAIQVTAAGGGVGQFVLTVRSAVPAVPPTPLPVDEPLSSTLNSGAEVVYSFTADPTDGLLLDVSILNSTQGLTLELKDSTGKTIALLDSSLLGSSLYLPPGAANYLLKLTNSIPNALPIEYEVSLTKQTIGELTSGQPELPTTGACVLATFNPIQVNIRSGPGQQYDPPIGTILPTEIYPVIGRNADSTWYQITYFGGQGWVAASVTRRGGNCGSVPVTSQETGGGQPQATEQATQQATEQATQQATEQATQQPTDQPTDQPTEQPTEEPTQDQGGQQQIAGDNEVTGVQIDIKNDSKAYSGYISYPNGNTQDSVSYTVTGFDSITTSGTVNITAICTGPGAENARVNFTGQASGGVPCNGAATSVFHTNDSAFGKVTVFIQSGDGAYVNWNLVFITNN